MFVIGGLSYTLVELLWRGYSHWTMFCLGGLCFRWIGNIAERTRGQRLVKRCGLCAAAVTLAEFLCGCIVNLWWGLGVWDYSAFPLNLLGQVCLLYSALWGLLSLIAMPLYTYLRRYLDRPVALGRVSEDVARRAPITKRPASPVGTRPL